MKPTYEERLMEDWFELTVILMNNATTATKVDMKDICKGDYNEAWAKGTYGRKDNPDPLAT